MGLRYVRGLERRVKELEQQVTPQSVNNSESLSCLWGQDVDILFEDSIIPPGDSVQSPQMQSLAPPAADTIDMSTSPTGLGLHEKTTDSLAEELRILSLQTAAERYLGPSSGLSFAKLTQAVLQQLSPDQGGFVFDRNFHVDPQQSPDTTSNFAPVFSDLYTSFPSALAFDSALGVPVVDSYEEPTDLALLQPSHINNILDFYFAHSHTLYPIIRKDEFISVLWRVYADPLDPLTLSSLWQFRIWMVLAVLLGLPYERVRASPILQQGHDIFRDCHGVW